jgi:DNA-binding GntR family transcriptional regulator
VPKPAPGASDLSSAASPLGPVLRDRGAHRTSDRVYDALTAAIRDLSLEPGRSLSETDLAASLHVSRTPLREAIARLVDAGLVQVVPQVGTTVALIRLSDVEEARFVRENLEAAAFEIACTDPARDIAALRRLITVQEQAAADHDLDGFFSADEAMHQQIFVMSGHPGAWQAVQRMKVQLDRLRRLSLPEPATLQELLVEHRLIVDALEQGLVDEGREHIRTHARRVLMHLPALRQKYPQFFAD